MERKAHFYEDVVDEVVEEVEVKDVCPECARGEMMEYDFVHMILKVCNNSDCGHKERKRKK